jgi:hypothetical protein
MHYDVRATGRQGTSPRHAARQSVRRAAAAVLLGFTAAGCDGLLTVDNPSSILDEDLNSPSGAAALAAGVAGSFNGAYSAEAVWSALLSDELLHTGTAPAERNASLGDVDVEAASFDALASARWAADDAARRFRELFDDADARPEVASMSIYSGFALLTLADNHCLIPIDGGPGQTPAEIYGLAEQRFTTALTVATAAGDAELQQRALAGRARARLMLGQHADARADARQVADGFVFLSVHGETTQNNAFPARTLSSIRREISVHPRYYQDTRFRSDPRVPFVDNDEIGVDGNSKFVEQRKYLTRADDMEIATWQEARLIEAEAEVRLGSPAAAVPLIDAVRADAGLAPYDGPVTPQAVLAQIAYERAAELFLEGQRLNDQRRFDDPWLDGRGTCFDISQSERDANPNVR